MGTRSKLAGLTPAVLAVMSMGASGGSTVWQSLQFENKGQNVVTNVVVHYARDQFPVRALAERMVPGALDVYSIASRVPDEASVAWTSGEGRRYEVSVALKGVFAHSHGFAGFTFSFVDDHVDVYLVERSHVGQLVELHSTKIFSSAVGVP